MSTSTLTVSAAASLTDALTEIGKLYEKRHSDVTVRFNFGASGTLKTQILAGAPVDIFVSASAKEMDDLQAAQRIVPGSRVDIAGNRLVLIVPTGSTFQKGDWRILTKNEVHRISISNIDSVPSGHYAKQTLEKRGLWAAVQTKAVYGGNVRQTLAYVANGDADVGIVFATDALGEARRVRVIATATNGRDHEPIHYPAAVVAGTANRKAAQDFVAFLRSGDAKRILKRYGFAV